MTKPDPVFSTKIDEREKRYGPWLEHDGGPRPVPDGQRCMLELRQNPNPANRFEIRIFETLTPEIYRWTHEGNEGDIVHYRLPQE